MAPARRFDPITVPTEAGRRRVHRFQCSHCPTVYDVSANTRGGARAEPDLRTVLRRNGWTLGKSANGDLCSDCGMAARKRQRAAKPEGASPQRCASSSVAPAPVCDLTSVPLAKVIMMQKTATAEPPPAMGVPDAFRIHSKLDEVYLDARKGYAEGWTDKRVSEDLDLPRAWVAEVRRMLHGDDARGDNVDIDRCLGEARALVDLMGEIEQRYSAAEKALDEARRERRDIAAERARIGRLLDDILRQVR